MRVHLIKRQTIINFTEKHNQGRISFELWLSVLKKADWDCPEDILSTFGSADLLGDGYDRVVFNIGGNKYRMICHYVFGEEEAHLFVCWLGTHAAYSHLCKSGMQYIVSDF
ncbi:type II toxin-antitoxin system HigB family toxin [Deminuibacter soli]|uniref:Type II toxin-antitoxin system HigB family toxin n=1 Tax=Deminuibacter soli TaxID=2291815 RepID=A0A3E1NER6_9BACT|nr:type II toxin-antitoxin system HigB family toxin [Deminuibacter soli]RFM26473.1 type II toxin-antitoxin system HigB family toxin [Deminuibacter soli]